ncbi:GspE/PulE family protein [Alteromonas oceanisediminis]|uniref:GspE/PulE family protein n=1 Tax=Alteromonas oceanisediminis TaxID=2836180 RepID=UPI001BDA55CE|nr:GspE/PulE family protein [Alteromonas oceanisediminis]MBT0585043.1 Flp pilus assembly complex ATPase component TadA [Alteromonas oceanisediminis]
MTRQIGALLREKGALSAKDLEKALNIQTEIGGKLGAILIRIGATSEEFVVRTLAEQLDLLLAGSGRKLPDPSDIVECCREHNIDIEWLVDQHALVWFESGTEHNLICASRDPLSEPLISALEMLCPQAEISPCFILSQDFDSLNRSINKIKDMYSDTAAGSESYLKELAEEAPTIELVNSLFAQAVDANASDIHFEPEEGSFRVRFRGDGVLTTKLTLGKEKFDALVSRIKLISGMDIAERRLPQDGSISTRAGGVEIDIRVSALPGVHGESMVLRLLPKDKERLSMEKLGMLPDQMALMARLVRQPHGIILVTGPTGSGKSTTLYTALDESNDHDKKIITVENPVEFKLEGITQTQTNEDIGLTFAVCLRTILRQDPDVIMIGEIRDLETAEIAMQAAITGHLVLSTLHTNDSLSAFTRLVDMGVEPFMAATPVIATQAQRLLRKLCTHCRQPASASPRDADVITELAESLGFSQQANWHVAVGCKDCQGTGYKGRVGIYELIEIKDQMRSLILEQKPVNEMYKLAKKQGHRDLYEDGMLKAFMGSTSVEEVFRVCRTSEANIE